MSQRSVFDTIRLSPREVRAILTELGSGQNFDTANTQRKARRWSLAGRKILVTIMDQNNNRQHYVSIARDLSASGLSFLHGGFLHIDRKCLISLPMVGGVNPQTIPAMIVRCRHLQKHLHDVGVLFDEAIDPRLYIDFGDEHVFTLEQVNIKDLQGTLLVIEDSTMFQKLVASYFAGSNLELKFADTAKTGLEMIGQVPDMVFVDYNLPDGDGLEIIRKARSTGYDGPMVMLTADTNPGLRQRAFEAGASEMLLKPCPPSILHQATAEYLLARRTVTIKQTSNESVSKSSDMVPELVAEFVRELQEQATRITQLFDSDDGLDELVGLCQQIMATGSGYGFDQIVHLASEALDTMTEMKNVYDSRTQLQRLVIACESATPPHSGNASMVSDEELEDRPAA